MFNDETRYMKVFKVKMPSVAGDGVIGEIGDLNIDRIIAIDTFPQEYRVSVWANETRNQLMVHVPNTPINTDIFVRMIYTKRDS